MAAYVVVTVMWADKRKQEEVTGYEIVLDGVLCCKQIFTFSDRNICGISFD